MTTHTTTILAEPGKQELLITREFDAPRELVFQAVVVKSAPEVAAALYGMEEGWNQNLDKLAEHLG